MRSHFSYEFVPGRDLHATYVCKDGQSDCGGLSCAMVAVLRANGVPARLLQGRWAQSQTTGDKASHS